MRPVLATLGPWDYSALPLLFVVLLALAGLWLWLEGRYGHFRGLTPARLGLGAVAAAVLSVVFFLLVKRFGPVEIKAYGTMLIVAFAAGAWFVSRYGDRRVLLPAEVVDMAVWALIGAILGSRIIFVALDWPTYAARPQHILNVWEGGLSFHGGLLGAMLAGLLFAHLRHKSFLRMADLCAPGIALGYAFARIGCFLNGCCHGHPSNLPWAMVFPHGEINDRPVHPTQLYALVASLAIMWCLIRLRPVLRFKGEVFAAYLFLYSIARFLLEFTRAGATGKYLEGSAGLTVGQFASIWIALLGLLYVVCTWRHRPAPESAAPAPSKAAQDGPRAR